MGFAGAELRQRHPARHAPATPVPRGAGQSPHLARLGNDTPLPAAPKPGSGSTAGAMPNTVLGPRHRRRGHRQPALLPALCGLTGLIPAQRATGRRMRCTRRVCRCRCRAGTAVLLPAVHGQVPAEAGSPAAFAAALSRWAPAPFQPGPPAPTRGLPQEPRGSGREGAAFPRSSEGGSLLSQGNATLIIIIIN